MAKMAIESLGRNDLSVLVCGPGRSIDYRWIARLGKVKKVAIADLVKLFDDAEWVDLNAPIQQRFDIVICCEVVEHFTDPANDFKKTLGYVNDDGMVVCSTNIYDGGKLENHSYLFIRGHTSYYTPKALAHIANDNDMHVDFRLPELAMNAGGPRKRYVIFTRSQQTLQNLAIYFGSHLFAPSEPNPQPATRQRNPAQNSTPNNTQPPSNASKSDSDVRGDPGAQSTTPASSGLGEPARQDP
jgi:SAM-dependent methyltransferase